MSFDLIGRFVVAVALALLIALAGCCAGLMVEILTESIRDWWHHNAKGRSIWAWFFGMEE